MRDVGHRHVHPHPRPLGVLALELHADRVIEVPRVGRVDRHEVDLAHVDPVLAVGFAHAGRGRLRRLEHLLRKLGVDSLLDEDPRLFGDQRPGRAQRPLDLDGEVVVPRVGVVDDCRHRHHARRHLGLPDDVGAAQHPRVIGLHDHPLPLAFDDPCDPRPRPLDHGPHRALGTALTGPPRDHDPIPIHRAAALVGRDEDRPLVPIALREPEPGRVEQQLGVLDLGLLGANRSGLVFARTGPRATRHARTLSPYRKPLNLPSSAPTMIVPCGVMATELSMSVGNSTL